METIQVKNLTDVVINGRLSKSINIGNQNIWNKVFPKIGVHFSYDGTAGANETFQIILKKTGNFTIYAFNGINDGVLTVFEETPGENGTIVYTPGGNNLSNLTHRVEIQQKSETASISEMTIVGNSKPFDHINLGNLPDLTKLDLGNVESKVKTFSLGKNKLNNIDQMFRNNTSLESVEIDAKNMISMIASFEGCTALTSAILKNTSKVTNMDRLFNGCIKLQEIPNLDTSSLLSINQTFKECNTLNDHIVIRNSIISYEEAFKNCSMAENAILYLDYSDVSLIPLIQTFVDSAFFHVYLGTLVS